MNKRRQFTEEFKQEAAAQVIEALIKQARKLPADLYKTLAWDRGSEITNHQIFTLATDIKVYLCDPQSPWQRVVFPLFHGQFS